jgi:hypothetical protein
MPQHLQLLTGTKVLAYWYKSTSLLVQKCLLTATKVLAYCYKSTCSLVECGEVPEDWHVVSDTLGVHRHSAGLEALLKVLKNNNRERERERERIGIGDGEGGGHALLSVV